MPIVEERPEPPAEGDDEEATSVPLRRILVVDDNRDSTDSLALLLARAA